MTLLGATGLHLDSGMLLFDYANECLTCEQCRKENEYIIFVTVEDICVTYKYSY